MRLSSLMPAGAVWFVVAVLVAPRCGAQTRGTIEFSSLLGTYVPTAQLPPEPIGCVALAGLSCRSSRQQNTAIVLGSRATAWVNRAIALEGSLWYSPSSLSGEFSSSLNGVPLAQETNKASAQVLATNVRVLVSLTRGAGKWVYVAGGPALINRFGDAGTAFAGTARLGGVVGAGAHFRVARALALRADVEDYLYSVQGYHQQDFVVSVGLSVMSRIASATTP